MHGLHKRAFRGHEVSGEGYTGVEFVYESPTGEEVGGKCGRDVGGCGGKGLHRREVHGSPTGKEVGEKVWTCAHALPSSTTMLPFDNINCAPPCIQYLYFIQSSSDTYNITLATHFLFMGSCIPLCTTTQAVRLLMEGTFQVFLQVQIHTLHPYFPHRATLGSCTSLCATSWPRMQTS